MAGSYRGPAPQTCLLADLTHSHREVGGSPRVPSSERFFFFSPLKYIRSRCNMRAMPSTVGVWQNTKYSLTAKGTRVSDACNELQHNPEPSGPSYSRPTEGHSHAKPPPPSRPDQRAYCEFSVILPLLLHQVPLHHCHAGRALPLQSPRVRLISSVGRVVGVWGGERYKRF